jgi:MoxR-like ATPase
MRFDQAFDEVFKYINLDANVQRSLKAVMLIRGGSAILRGIPGTGKTTTVESIAKAFDLKLGKITCSPQKVTLEGSFFRLSIPDLLNKGEEKIIWKPIAEADVIFISEINRAPQSFQDELIDLLQYKEIEAYSNIKTLKEHTLMFFDMNPYRGGLDKAISDRPICSITFPRADFFKRYNISNSRFNKRSLRDVRQEIQSKATLDDLLECQAEVEKIEIDTTILALATLITESFSTCIYNRDFASDRWVPPCASDKLNKLGEVELEQTKCEFHGEICSCIKSPLAYRIDEALVILSKSFAYLDGEPIILQKHMLEALQYVVGNRLELRDSIAKHWVDPSAWVKKELFNYLNAHKLPQWSKALLLWKEVQKNQISKKERDAKIEQLQAFGAKNLELRELLRSIGINTFVKEGDVKIEVDDDE